MNAENTDVAGAPAAEAPGKGLRWVVVLLVLVLGAAGAGEFHLRRKEERVAAMLEAMFEAATKAPDSLPKLAPRSREVMTLMAELDDCRRFRPWTRTFEDHEELVPAILLGEAVSTGNRHLNELRQAKTEPERELARQALREHIAHIRSTGKALKSPHFERNAKVFEAYAKKIAAAQQSGGSKKAEAK